jgi:hypothetical protein
LAAEAPPLTGRDDLAARALVFASDPRARDRRSDDFAAARFDRDVPVTSVAAGLRCLVAVGALELRAVGALELRAVGALELRAAGALELRAAGALELRAVGAFDGVPEAGRRLFDTGFAADFDVGFLAIAVFVEVRRVMRVREVMVDRKQPD